MTHIRNPVEWGVGQLTAAGHAIEALGRTEIWTRPERHSQLPAVRRIAVSDIWVSLAQGLADFGTFRTDVIFICGIYPLIGVVLARLAFGYEMLPLIFPLASGFALVGPVAAVGLYEMSRRREQGLDTTWAHAFGVVRSPSFGAIVVLGLLLMLIFSLWLGAADAIYRMTLGPEPPLSIGSFLHDVFYTDRGWIMIVVGIGVGFLFALLVLVIGVVSFPLLLEHQVGLDTAVRTSVRAVIQNPRPMALWGMIVAGSLVIGSLPIFLGLIVVVPLLGHTTWHLYRKVVVWPPDASHDQPAATALSSGA